MADVHEHIVGFPKARLPFAWPPTEVVLEIPTRWPVLCILGVLGQSIHGVVNSWETKITVYQLFKCWKNAQHRAREKDEEAWTAWLAWCRKLGCPV